MAMNPVTGKPQFAAFTCDAAELSDSPPFGNTSTAGLAPHLLELEKDEWAVWRFACLRGAGFPAALVLGLAAGEFARAADQVLEAEDVVFVQMEKVRSAINRSLDNLRENGRWNDRKKRSQLLDALHDLKAGRMPEPFDADTASLIDDCRSALERLRSCRLSAQLASKSAIEDVSRNIREMASSSRFQEAILWQNHRAWLEAVQPLLRGPAGQMPRSSKRRQQEELVSSYLQRYCVKNDTIGFFGPVGWANFNPAINSLALRTGPELVATQNVYFEGWCIDTLAETIARDRSLKPWFIPRSIPLIRVEEGTVYFSDTASLRLQPGQAALLQSCDGKRTAKVIAAEVLLKDPISFKCEEDVYRGLEALCEWGILRWTLEIPLQRNPEKALRRRIEEIEDERGRNTALNSLNELESARDRIAASSGSPETLAHELRNLDECFGRLTGEASARAAGQTYGARTLVYQDCRRDSELEIGKEVLNALAPGLSLVLTSARWMTDELAKLYRQAFRSVYEKMSSKSRSKVVSAVDFWLQCQAILYPKNDQRIADQVGISLRNTWSEILCLRADANKMSFTCAELKPRIEKAFGGRRSGWTLACYNTPDVMIAAANPEALLQGDFHLVLGEVHFANNCLNSRLFVEQHPHPENVQSAISADSVRPRLLPFPPKNWPSLTVRTSVACLSAGDYQLMVSPDTGGVPSSPSVPISSLIVEDCNGELTMRTRDHRLQFEIVEAFGAFLSEIVMHWNIFPELRHMPRITVDRLTLGRETWRFLPSEIEFTAEKDETQRFLGARRWRREFDLPRFVFVKSPRERKPFYLDFESPILISLFAKMVRNAGQGNQPHALISLSEMFPAHGQLWLPDNKGDLYTGELRIVAVDLNR